jgi:thioredoxin 1
MILNDENFDKEIQRSKTPVLVDFFAEWCGPCSTLGPILEEVAKDYEGKIVLAKVNVDEAPLVSQKYQVAQIPTVILFKDGKPKNGFVGVRPEDVIKQWLDENI